MFRAVNVARKFADTLPYQSPEMATGLSYDSKSDIWSLGCVVYEMATRTLPVSDSTFFHCQQFHATRAETCWHMYINVVVE